MERRDVLQKAVLAAGAAVLAPSRPAQAAPCATVTFDGETATQRFFKITSGNNVCAVSLVSAQPGNVFSNNVSRGCLSQYRVALPKNNAIYWALVVTNNGTEACCFRIMGMMATPVPPA
jgi:hypothetical protein